MRKKGIAVVLSLAMIVSVVTGCGKEKEEVTTQEIVTEASTQEIEENSSEDLALDDSSLSENADWFDAYDKYIENNYADIKDSIQQYNFVYIDDDDIPELVMSYGVGSNLTLSYYNGEIIILGNSSHLNFGYIPQKGYYYVSGMNGGDRFHYYLSEGENNGVASCTVDEAAEDYSMSYLLGLKIVTEEEYNDFISSLGSFTDGYEGSSSSLKAAYEKILNKDNTSDVASNEQLYDIYPDDLDQYSLREGNAFLEKVIFGGTDFNDLQTYFEGLPKHDFENGYPTSFSISSDRAELSGYDIMGCRTDYTIYATNPLEYKDDSGKIIHTAKSRIEMLENDGESLGVYSTFEKMLRNQDVSYKSEKIEGSAYVTFMEVGINLSDSHDVSLEDSDEVFIQKSSDYQTVTTDDLRSYFESITLEDYKKYTSIKREGNIDGLSGDCYSFVIDEIPWDEYTGVEGDAILIVIDIPDYCFDFAPEELEGLGIDFGVSIYSKTDYLSGVEEE